MFVRPTFSAMTMTMQENQTKLLALIREALACNKPNDNKVELLEDTLLAAGLTREFVALGLKKLAEDGVIELRQMFYAPNRTLSSYETDTKYKVPADDLYNKPVYVLHINRKETRISAVSKRSKI